MNAIPVPPAAVPLLGELLLERGAIRPADLERALELQRGVGGRIGSLLIRIGALSEDQLIDALSVQLGLPVAGRDLPLPTGLAEWRLPTGTEVPLDWMQDREILLWEDEDGQAWCASRDPLDAALQEALAYLWPQREIRAALAPAQLLERTLDTLAQEQRGGDAWGSDDVRHLRELAEEAPVVELVNSLLAQAVEQRASDIHLEPEENQFVVRFRIDGVLYSRLRLPRERFNAVASRLKLISGMDIAERRLPQDGRMSVRASGQAMDIRASALPGVHGESIVLRLLPKERKDLGLERLGMAPDHLRLLQGWSREAHGIVLVTGPTGSGKSTTLYATLAASNDGMKKIITVEDPVEFQLPGITQIQTQADIGLTFASVLRSILRQDPDVIMVGEIRDRETAEIAIQSALTGHLVLSTVHTNDALGAFTRLIDMGVEPFLVATPLKGVQAQRLVRRLCPHCARPAQVVDEALAAETAQWTARVFGAEAPAARWMEAVGCPRCQNTGYQGRIGIYELVPVDEAMQQAVVSGATHQQLRQMARERGFRFLREDGLLKAWQGVTTVDEVLRVTAV
ncbi:type II secretion system protein [Pseudoxanthomonas jiangsuensis]|uniref:GspE/PulE family protein n=1 Tax=Pseudoxanthomonas jiangsuensis TaxID=619688 RepID=UPI001390B687|nr:GspE/PulE family protein [Pseudoxanthomonas jiangsuensis]KAF1699359.1 type II secretion system protein [Pseudoxanthomonas jiangsuensis]